VGRKYSLLYKKIVKDERDVIGHIAYALYKAAKIKHIEKYKSEHDGEDPSEDYLEHFHNISCLEEEVERYKLQATAILQDFLTNTVTEILEDTEQDLVDAHLDMVKDALADTEKELKPKSFMYGVWQSVVGAVLFMIILGAIIFGATFSQKEYVITLGHGNATVEETEYHPSPDTSATVAQPHN
jgi:uncharacterized membrane protein